jgi:FkbM family methyltransferase
MPPEPAGRLPRSATLPGAEMTASGSFRRALGGLPRRLRRALARNEYPVVPAHLGRIDYEGTEIRIGVTTRAEMTSRLRPVAKEPWTVAWLERNARPGGVLYDVGANVGGYSLIAAALGMRVVAFEPGYANYAALCDNVVLNERTAEIIPLPTVLADHTGLDVFGYRDVAAGVAEHRLGGAGTTLPVLTYRLDDLVDQLDLPAATLLKLDVDGAEEAVLAGAPQVLAGTGLRSVLVEVERDRSAEVVRLIEAAGFRVAERIDDRDGERLARVWYGIFERND